MKKTILGLVILAAATTAHAGQLDYLWHGCVGEPAKAAAYQHDALTAQGYAIDSEGHVKREITVFTLMEKDYAYLCSEAEIAQAVSKLSSPGKMSQSEIFMKLKARESGDILGLFGW